MLNSIYKFLIATTVVLSALAAGPIFVQAETHITDETIFGPNLSWTKDGNPYVLDDDIFLPSYMNIYIGPGVTVQSSADAAHYLFMRNSDIRIDGTATEPVVFSGLSELDINTSTSSISHVLINVPTGLSIFGGTTTISSSTITGATAGIAARAASINIQDSVLTGNSYGIYSYFVPKGPVLSLIPYAFADSVSDPTQNDISIHNSVITGNTLAGIFNVTSNTVSAENNWWGSDAGPQPADTHGLVDVAPWLTKDPRIVTLPASPCCSSVLFLPGIEASRLYRDQRGLLSAFFGTSTNQLWEPNRNDDVRKLFLDDNGKSLDSSIYTKDIIDSVFGFGIYKDFIAMMNGVVADGVINAWQAFPYDWRQSVDAIVSNPTRYATTTQILLNIAQAMASSSKTGKITIVAHSNGGLVAKMLVKILHDQGKASLIDKVILVAVPELGTPQAVASLLHGDGQDILGGIILSKSVARQLGQNAPGAYGLLPSKDYFLGFSATTSTPVPSLLGPIISFAKSTLAGLNFSGYQKIQKQPQSASAYDAFRGFLAGLLDRRSTPSPADTQSPILLRTSMIDAEQKIHDAIDNFIFPSSTPAISLIGWGKKTVDAINYLERSICTHPDIPGIFQPCMKALTYVATTTKAGDGTVVAASAAAADSKDYYLNMASSDAEHATILDHDSTLTFVKDEIVPPASSGSSSISPTNHDPLLAIPDITSTFPTAADLASDDLIVTTHSPVDLGIYDSQGRYTGQIPNPDSTSDLGRYVVNIPGSDFRSNPDEGYNIDVPYGDTYKVVLNGTGVGTFTLDTEHEINGGTVASTTFADMPVTPLLTAELDLAPTTATSSQVLMVDNDGDGTIDATSSPHGPVDYYSDDEAKNKYLQKYFQSIREIIMSLHLSPAKEKTELAKIDKILDLLKKGKKIKADEAAEHAADAVAGQHWAFRKMDDTQRQALFNVFDSILDSMSEDK
jgi:pimeloyl-ACP methyl ester carboxylesterase